MRIYGLRGGSIALSRGRYGDDDDEDEVAEQQDTSALDSTSEPAATSALASAISPRVPVAQAAAAVSKPAEQQQPHQQAGIASRRTSSAAVNSVDVPAIAGRNASLLTLSKGIENEDKNDDDDDEPIGVRLVEQRGNIYGSLGSSIALSMASVALEDLEEDARLEREARIAEKKKEAARRASISAGNGALVKNAGDHASKQSLNAGAGLRRRPSDAIGGLQSESMEIPEPEIPDGTPVGDIMRAIAREHEWTDEELLQDLEELRRQRIRTAKDVRKVTMDGWAEMTRLLPVTKDMLRSAVQWKENVKGSRDSGHKRDKRVRRRSAGSTAAPEVSSSQSENCPATATSRTLPHQKLFLTRNTVQAGVIGRAALRGVLQIDLHPLTSADIRDFSIGVAASDLPKTPPETPVKGRPALAPPPMTVVFLEPAIEPHHADGHPSTSSWSLGPGLSSGPSDRVDGPCRKAATSLSMDRKKGKRKDHHGDMVPAPASSGSRWPHAVRRMTRSKSVDDKRTAMAEERRGAAIGRADTGGAPGPDQPATSSTSVLTKLSSLMPAISLYAARPPPPPTPQPTEDVVSRTSLSAAQTVPTPAAPEAPTSILSKFRILQPLLTSTTLYEDAAATPMQPHGGPALPSAGSRPPTPGANEDSGSSYFTTSNPSADTRKSPVSSIASYLFSRSSPAPPAAPTAVAPSSPVATSPASPTSPFQSQSPLPYDDPILVDEQHPPAKMTRRSLSRLLVLPKLSMRRSVTNVSASASTSNLLLSTVSSSYSAAVVVSGSPPRDVVPIPVPQGRMIFLDAIDTYDDRDGVRARSLPASAPIPISSPLPTFRVPLKSDSDDDDYGQDDIEPVVDGTPSPPSLPPPIPASLYSLNALTDDDDEEDQEADIAVVGLPPPPVDIVDGPEDLVLDDRDSYSADEPNHTPVLLDLPPPTPLDGSDSININATRPPSPPPTPTTAQPTTPRATAALAFTWRRGRTRARGSTDVDGADVAHTAGAGEDADGASTGGSADGSPSEPAPRRRAAALGAGVGRWKGVRGLRRAGGSAAVGDVAANGGEESGVEARGSDERDADEEGEGGAGPPRITLGRVGRSRSTEWLRSYWGRVASPVGLGREETGEASAEALSPRPDSPGPSGRAAVPGPGTGTTGRKIVPALKRASSRPRTKTSWPGQNAVPFKGGFVLPHGVVPGGEWGTNFERHTMPRNSDSDFEDDDSGDRLNIDDEPPPTSTPYTMSSPRHGSLSRRRSGLVKRRARPFSAPPEMEMFDFRAGDPGIRSASGMAPAAELPIIDQVPHKPVRGQRARQPKRIPAEGQKYAEMIALRVSDSVEGDGRRTSINVYIGQNMRQIYCTGGRPRQKRSFSDLRSAPAQMIMEGPPRYKVVRCRFAWRPSGCSRGRDCTFLHPEDLEQHVGYDGTGYEAGGYGGEEVTTTGTRLTRNVDQRFPMYSGPPVNAPPVVDAAENDQALADNPVPAAPPQQQQHQHPRRANNSNLRTRPCRYHFGSGCSFGDRCRYAHAEPTERIVDDTVDDAEEEMPVQLRQQDDGEKEQQQPTDEGIDMQAAPVPVKKAGSKKKDGTMKRTKKSKAEAGAHPSDASQPAPAPPQLPPAKLPVKAKKVVDSPPPATHAADTVQPVLDPTPSTPKSPRTSRPCNYFLRGACRFGPACRFSHAPASAASPSDGPVSNAESVPPSNRAPAVTRYLRDPKPADILTLVARRVRLPASIARQIRGLVEQREEGGVGSITDEDLEGVGMADKKWRVAFLKGVQRLLERGLQGVGQQEVKEGQQGVEEGQQGEGEKRIGDERDVEVENGELGKVSKLTKVAGKKKGYIKGKGKKITAAKVEGGVAGGRDVLTEGRVAECG
ncbi:hypothetical protein HK101_009863 [Irineochytrium annulatum]|nr:hypothetical protein HK101_009863 [Irineochytrium annulatum]